MVFFRGKPTSAVSTKTLSVFKVVLLNAELLKDVDYVAGVIWPGILFKGAVICLSKLSCCVEQRT
jgi:hypothetical protein